MTDARDVKRLAALLRELYKADENGFPGVSLCACETCSESTASWLLARGVTLSEAPPPVRLGCGWRTPDLGAIEQMAQQVGKKLLATAAANLPLGAQQTEIFLRQGPSILLSLVARLRAALARTDEQA